jgi:hypothetical protein
MKKILLLFTFFFFATQIIPIKYIGYLCYNEVCDLSCDDDTDTDDCPLKLKVYVDIHSKDYLYHNCLAGVVKIRNSRFPIYCINIPEEYIQTILIPPPIVYLV